MSITKNIRNRVVGILVVISIVLILLPFLNMNDKDNSKPQDDNAIAERVNGIIKMEKVYRMHVFKDIECARDTIGRYIQFYNNRRPHMSIGYKTPSKVHLEQGIQQKMWKKKIYTSKKKDS